MVGPAPPTGVWGRFRSYEQIDLRGREIIVTSSDGPEFTVIDADIRGVVVTASSGETRDTVLHGFTLTRGLRLDDTDARGRLFNHGGGVWVNEASPTLSWLIVENNAAVKFGGGVAIRGEGASRLLVDSVVCDNWHGYDPGKEWLQQWIDETWSEPTDAAQVPWFPTVMAVQDAAPTIQCTLLEGNAGGAERGMGRPQRRCASCGYGGHTLA